MDSDINNEDFIDSRAFPAIIKLPTCHFVRWQSADLDDK